MPVPIRVEGKDPYLTTVDNPYCPKDEFWDWWQLDQLRGHYTNELLARVVFTADALPPADQDEAILLAMEEIVEHNVSGVHKIVWR